LRLTIVIQNKTCYFRSFLELENATWDLRPSRTWYRNLRLTIVIQDLSPELVLASLEDGRDLSVLLSGQSHFQFDYADNISRILKKKILVKIYRFLVKKIFCVFLKRKRFSFYNRIQKNCIVKVYWPSL